MIQCPISFCLTLSFISAFFDPNSFIANLLSVGAKMFCSWFLTQFGFASLDTEFLNEIFSMTRFCAGPIFLSEMFSKAPNRLHYVYLDVFAWPGSSFGVP